MTATITAATPAAAITTVSYRIRNISGVVTFHARRFLAQADVDAFLADVARQPWVTDVKVVTP